MLKIFFEKMLQKNLTFSLSKIQRNFPLQYNVKYSIINNGSFQENFPWTSSSVG